MAVPLQPQGDLTAAEAAAEAKTTSSKTVAEVKTTGKGTQQASMEAPSGKLQETPTKMQCAPAVESVTELIGE